MSTRKMTVSSGRHENGLRLTIEDEASGMILAKVNLDADQAWKLMGGGYIHVDGEHTDHFDRIGKRMLVAQEVYTHQMLSASTRDTMVEDAEQSARADRPGWDTYTGRRNNTGGVTVVLRKWR